MKKTKTALNPLKNGARFVFLHKETDLNKILKNQKRSKETLNLLFVSPWDDWCSNLVDKLKSDVMSADVKEVVYVVNSFMMPHSFVIFNSAKLPHLIRLEGERVFSEDYLPLIYQFFGLD